MIKKLVAELGYKLIFQSLFVHHVFIVFVKAFGIADYSELKLIVKQILYGTQSIGFLIKLCFGIFSISFENFANASEI